MYSYTMNHADKMRYNEIRERTKSADDATKLWIRWKCLTDLFYLAAEVFDLRSAKSRKTNRYLLDPRFHRQMARYMETDEDTLILEPRYSLKSTFMKYSIIQRILRNPDVRIGLWSKTTNLARKELKAIKTMFCQPILLEIFPDIVIERKLWEKDTADEFTMKRPENEGFVQQENQIEAWGVGSTVAGHHYDVHIYDDPIDEKSITTTVQLEKIQDWWAHVQAIRSPEAFEKMVGTRYHYHDIYGMIIQEGYFKPENIVIRKAVEGGKIAYKYFTQEYLDRQRKRMGEHIYHCQFQNEIVALQDKPFIPPYPEYIHPPKGEKLYYITVDPATGKQYSNKTGICVACTEKDHPSHVYFVEAYRLNQPPDVLASEIVRKVAEYQPRKLGIELGLQQGLQPLIEIKLREYRDRGQAIQFPEFIDIPVRIGQMSKTQKISRTLGAMVRDGRVLFKNTMRDLYWQMDNLNPNSDANEDDIVDAAAMMMMIVPIGSYSHWWKSESRVHSGMNIEDVIHMVNKKKSSWGAKFAC